MIVDMDMSLEKKWLGEERAKVAVKNLCRRNIHAEYFATRQETLEAVMKRIPPGATVARGDSISVDQVGVIPELIKRQQNKVIDPFRWDAEGYYIDSTEAREQMYRDAFSADIFLAGTNGVTMDGKLVNVDGYGNRVAAMIFGPKKVILIVGVNKIVRDVDEALERIHQWAAPLNAKRWWLKHHEEDLADLPCVKMGRCVECVHDSRICSFTVIIDGTPASNKGRIYVALVGEELGI